MSFAKKILGHIFFFYGGFIFLFFMLIIAVPAALLSRLFKEPFRTRLIHPAYKLWMSIVFPLILCPVRRKGKENFADNENYVVVINHNSFLDIPVSAPWIPGPNKTLAKIEFSKIPIFNLVYNSGSILVDRKDEKSRKESFTKMQKTLRQGLHLCLYPEGTRNKTEEILQPFFEGAFVTAIRAQKPVIPGIIMNTKHIMPRQPKFWGWPHVIHYHFLEPVPTEGLTIRDRHDLMDRVHQIMKDYLIENEPKYR